MAKNNAEEKNTKKKNQKNEIKKDKKKKVKKENYFVGVKSEMSKVKWPNKQEVIKYTIATLIFIIVLIIFFVLLSLLMSFVKGAFN